MNATLEVKMNRQLNDSLRYLSSVKEYTEKELPSAVLKDVHQCLLHYHITDPSVKWSHVFKVMESAKSELRLEDYTVSDTSLEQIFLSFAKQ